MHEVEGYKSEYWLVDSGPGRTGQLSHRLLSWRWKHAQRRSSPGTSYAVVSAQPTSNHPHYCTQVKLMSSMSRLKASNSNLQMTYKCCRSQKHSCWPLKSALMKSTCCHWQQIRQWNMMVIEKYTLGPPTPMVWRFVYGVNRSWRLGIYSACFNAVVTSISHAKVRLS